MTVTISLAGDLFLQDYPERTASIDETVKSLFEKSDIAIVNFEAPIIGQRSASQTIAKDGPNLRMDETVLDLLANAGVNTVSLANNHIMDYGAEGLASTIESCRKHGLRHLGAGDDLAAAATPLVYQLKDKKIGFIAVCENEWSTTADASPGANGLDLINNFYSIKELKSVCDAVVVIVHGGSERYNLPSPRTKRTMRFFVDAGADAVVMHHAHCISGMEVYNDRPIFFGLGNFFFNNRGQPKYWYQGVIVNLSIAENGACSWEVNFSDVTGDGSQVGLAAPESEREARAHFEQLSAAISDDLRLASEWDAFIDRSASFYSQVLSAINLLPTTKLRGMARRLGVAKHLLPRRHLVHLINYITCESHLDVSRSVLLKMLRGR